MSDGKNQQNRALAAKIVHVGSIVIAAVLFEVFLVLCLHFFYGEWRQAIYLLALIGGSAVNAAVLTLDLVFYFLKKEIVYKFCITAYILGIFFAVAFYVLLSTGFMDVLTDARRLDEFLSQSGGVYAGTVLLFVLLQFLQVVVLPIPSTVTVVAGALLFGPLLGSLYSLAGIVLGSLVAFLVGRYAGHKVVGWLIGRETLEKWLKKIKGKDKLLLTAMFLLPVFPDDVLCFVAGLSSMSLVYFLIVIILSRIFAIFTTSYSISLIPFDTWWGLLIWGVLIVAVIVLFVFLYKKSDAILGWFEKKFHRETRVTEEVKKDEFTLQIIDPDGSIVEKGVKREGESKPPEGVGNGEGESKLPDADLNE